MYSCVVLRGVQGSGVLVMCQDLCDITVHIRLPEYISVRHHVVQSDWVHMSLPNLKSLQYSPLVFIWPHEYYRLSRYQSRLCELFSVMNYTTPVEPSLDALIPTGIRYCIFRLPSLLRSKPAIVAGENQQVPRARVSLRARFQFRARVNTTNH